MKRVLAVVFSAALLSSIFAPMAGATNSPGKAGGNATGGGTSNGPAQCTPNGGNGGNHNGTDNFGNSC